MKEGSIWAHCSLMEYCLKKFHDVTVFHISTFLTSQLVFHILGRGMAVALPWFQRLFARQKKQEAGTENLCHSGHIAIIISIISLQ